MTRVILILHYSRDTVKNFKVKKRVYKRVIYYFPLRWKKIYLIVFSHKFLFLNFFLVSNKNFGEKLLNILFQIKMENNTFNSIFPKIFVSLCIYKLIIYIYIYLVVLRQRFTKTIGSALESNQRWSQMLYAGTLELVIFATGGSVKPSIFRVLRFTEVVNSIFLIFYNINFCIFLKEFNGKLFLGGENIAILRKTT